MSTLPGGPADKAGNNHEALWGVAGMVSVLGELAKTIRIEQPGTNGAEFYLEKNEHLEHWQAKRQVLGQKTWSLQLLSKEGILSFFRQRIDEGETCVFASISDAPELRGLSENACAAEDWLEFQSEFLKAAEWQKHFKELKKHLDYDAGSDVFEYLRKIRVEGARESTLEGFLLPIFKASFSGSPQTTLTILRDLYATSVHKKFHAKDILRHLESHGVKARTLEVSAKIRDSVQSITATYVAGQRVKLIGGKHISRQPCSDIIKKLQSSNNFLDILLVSPAGGGKSAGILEIAAGLITLGVPVLAFRLDRIDPVTSTEELGRKLGLPESPTVVLSQCYPNQTVALIVDQLDFVSATSGRHPDFFEVVAALAEEIRGLRRTQKFHLVTACREFDLQNDSRIRRLLSHDTSPVKINLFSTTEVRSVIDAQGIDPQRLSKKQLELLKLPQNLALFVESGLGRDLKPSFVTQKELFDGYWDQKHRTLSNRFPEDSTQWKRIIAKLTGEMSTRQQLSVQKARTDEFSPAFLTAMVSEGVLNYDGNRYGFGHESFFDYCFAREAASAESDFVEFIKHDPQELFRRAQLRQVLVFLRDADHPQFVRSVETALDSERIRPHLKLLVLQLLAALQDPLERELEILMPMLESELASRSKSIQNPNRTATLAWEAFFMSAPLFALADRLGHVEKWLHSGLDPLENQMTYYLRAQSRNYPDRVAVLLEPFTERSGRWNDRLRFIMQWADLGESRRLFKLFLRLIDCGTLDLARGPIAINSTFWSILQGLDKKRPDWCAEAASHWLKRKVAIAQSSSAGTLPELNDQFGVNSLLQCARGDAYAYLQHVLPVILSTAESFVFSKPSGLQLDRIWSFRSRGRHIGMAEAFPKGCEIAFESLGSTSWKVLHPFIEMLLASRLSIANQLLQHAYASAPEMYANEAIKLLINEPERLLCGVSGSQFSTACTVIQKCSPHCSDELFQKLERELLGYKTDYERSKDGFRNSGYSAFTLASALDPNRRSESTNRRLAEWNRKFGCTPEHSPSVVTGFVGSPIAHEEAGHMSDDQWLQAIATHTTDSGVRDWQRPFRGGAYELSKVLQTHVANEPERFAKLALKFPAACNPYYLKSVLHGLKDTVVDPELKVEVARRAFELDDSPSLAAAITLLASIKDSLLPHDAIQFINRMATEHPDPDPTVAEHDLLEDGMNTVRGHGVNAIANLILGDKGYIEIFRRSIEQSVHDPSLSVRACVAATVSAVAVHEPEWALQLFDQLLRNNDRLFASHYVCEFIASGLQTHIDELIPKIERMLRSYDENVQQAGGRIASLARLHHPQHNEIVANALKTNSSCRLGVAEVASQNLILPSCKSWCETTLAKLFDDNNETVRETAAGCFWHLWQNPDTPLSNYNVLIQSFIGSAAFAESPSYLLHALEDTRQRIPETVLDVCEIFVERCSEKARDISTALAADETTIGNLIFRAYAQLEATPLRVRALDLIDQMCLEGLQSANKHFSDFER